MEAYLKIPPVLIGAPGKKCCEREKYMNPDRESIESRTADLFPRIHGRATDDERRYYTRTVHAAIGEYLERFGARNPAAGGEVLEVGCGGRASGIFSLAAFGPASITAVDLSERNVELSRGIADRLGIGNLRVMQGNALALEFEDGRFDFVFSNGVIHHTADPEAAFRELVRVTRPGGYVFLGVYGYGGLWGKVVHPLGVKIGKIVPLEAAERFVNRTGFLRSQENSLLDWFYTPVQEFYTPAEVARWFSAAGLADVGTMKSAKWFFNLGPATRLLFGHGYIFAMGRKRGNGKTDGTQRTGAG